jgi:hypothetical protein
VGALEQEVARQSAQWGCRTAYDYNELRRLTECNLRVQRIRQEMVAHAVKPAAEEVEAFYTANRYNFPRPEMFHASHIVKYVNHEQSEEQAESGIEIALAELERGEPFAEVANRHSDCRASIVPKRPMSTSSYNYSPSWGTPNPQETGNQFSTSPSAPPSPLASAHFNDFFNTGNNSGTNIQYELCQFYTQGSNSNSIQQVQTATKTAFDNYIIYLQHTHNMTGSNGLIDPNNNSTSGPPYYTW